MLQRRLGVVGHPISHSLSPMLHRAAYEVLGVPWSYEAIDVEPGGLTQFVNAVDESWLGLSVTMPHKIEALHLATAVDLIGRATGSVNTLVFRRDDRGERIIEGFNTDVAGMVAALFDAGVTSAREVAVIGGGATASSAVAAAAELGAERVTILVRDVERAEYLIAVGNSVGVAVRVHELSDMRSVTPVDLAIATLPGTVDTSLDGLGRKPHATLLDVAYSPWPSIRGSEWESHPLGGGPVVSGLAMLAHQALIQVRLFTSGDATEVLPHEDDVRTAMFDALTRR